MKKNRKIVAYASITLFFALFCVYALAGGYWKARLSGETDLFTFLRYGGYTVALVEGNSGGSEMIEVDTRSRGSMAIPVSSTSVQTSPSFAKCRYCLTV